MKRIFLLLPIAALLCMLLVNSASADGQAEQFNQFYEGYSGNLDHFTFSAVCDECWGDDWDPLDGYTGLGTSIGVDGNFNWKANASSLLTYDSARIRQGSTLDTMTTTLGIPGSVTVNYKLYGHWGLHQDADGDGPGPWNPVDPFAPGVDVWLTSTIPCDIPLQPGEYLCEKEEDFGLGSVWTPFAYAELTLRITTKVTMDQTGVVGVRTAIVEAGQPIADAPVTYLGPGPGLFIDPLFISCTQPEGEMLTYALENMHVTASDIQVGQLIGLHFVVKDPTLSSVWTDVSFFDVNLFGTPNFHTVNVTTPDVSFELGELAPDITPPTIEDLGFFIGWEGSPIQLEADAHDNCGAPTLKWEFSDGGVAFGPSPEHVFPDNGVYSGILTATDVTGLTTTSTFTVTVLNKAPAANAGPDAIDAWGIPLPFNGQAVDASWVDQTTLSYEWDFGDNTPKGHAKDVTHAYSLPGDYTATIKVCDKEGACGTDSRLVTIRRRGTSLGYLGSYNWTFDTQASLSASLVDEFGQAVNGRGIEFSVGAFSAGSASTNSSGIAQRGYQVIQGAGFWGVQAGFAGDALYQGSVGQSLASVSTKGTNIVYTGTLVGGPNKTIALSATLKDSDGNALSGRTVTFSLGTQTVTAVTGTNGVAQTALKITQKQGTYTLQTTWTPLATDGARYSPSSDVDTFLIGK